METSCARERGDQARDHACEQAEEFGVRAVLAISEGGAKRRLMGERREGVYVGEEVVHEQLQHAKGRDALLSVQHDRAIGEAQGHERVGSIMCWRRRHLRSEVIVLDSSSLLGFSCSFGGPVRWAPSLLDALICAGYVQLATGSAWRWSTFALGTERSCQLLGQGYAQRDDELTFTFLWLHRSQALGIRVFFFCGGETEDAAGVNVIVPGGLAEVPWPPTDEYCIGGVTACWWGGSCVWCGWW